MFVLVGLRRNSVTRTSHWSDVLTQRKPRQNTQHHHWHLFVLGVFEQSSKTSVLAFDATVPNRICVVPVMILERIELSFLG